jgi:uncharacterized protein (TIGR03503 family)
MVSIKNPMPGPWQAVGQVNPDSRVMVISDLKLHADPLPNIIFSGEILKQTAYLTNNGEPIDYTAFRDVVELTIKLSSTNNPNYNNFGSNPETVAFFEDNGKGMDEKPLDGIFTGQFNLAIADGEWIPTFTVSTPMFTREQVDPNIMLLSNPIKVDVELDGGGQGYHKLNVDADRKYVDMSTLLIDGKIRFPNGDIQNFSVTDMSADIREYLIVNYEYGVYRVKLTAYGNTTDGREFILDVPEYSFLTEEPEPEPEVATMQSEVDGSATGDNLSVQDSMSPVAMPAKEQKMATATLISIIVGINLFILLAGGGLIWWLTSGKTFNFAFLKKTKKEPLENQEVKSEKQPGIFARIFKRKPKQMDVKEPAQSSSEGKDEDKDEFMNLSMPKE